MCQPRGGAAQVMGESRDAIPAQALGVARRYGRYFTPDEWD